MTEQYMSEPDKHADMSYEYGAGGAEEAYGGGSGSLLDDLKQDNSQAIVDGEGSMTVQEPELDQRSKIQTSLRQVEVTLERPPYVPTDEDEARFRNAGTARVNLAATPDRPDGTTEHEWARKHSHQTVLQQHCDFFDPDGDGIIWPLDTYGGFRAIGFNILISVSAMFVIHSTFSYPTVRGYLPDPFFRLFLANIHKTKHGSDSGTYDNEGRFVPQHFEDFFSKYGRDMDGDGENDGLDAWDLWTGVKGQRVLADPFGATAVILEWLATYLFFWPKDGILYKEQVRKMYDGSIFYEMAEQRGSNFNKRHPIVHKKKM